MTIKELENQISKLQTKLEKLKQAEKEKNKEELKNKLKPWRAEEGAIITISILMERYLAMLMGVLV